MKTNSSHQRTGAFTAFEVLVIVAVLLLLVALLLHHYGRSRRVVDGGTTCFDNLRQIGLAFLIWEGDNGGKYPTAVSVTNGGAMELVSTGDVAACFLAMSNCLNTPLVLACPQDPAHPPVHSFGPGYDRSHISYFVNPDVTNDHNPRLVMMGDDDLITGHLPLKSGVSELSTNASIWWSGFRHPYGGNLGFADGSVREISDAELPQTFVETAIATNHLAVP